MVGLGVPKSPEAGGDEAEVGDHGGDHGDDRGDPGIATHPAIEGPGGDELTDVTRIVEALHVGQPGPLVDQLGGVDGERLLDA